MAVAETVSSTATDLKYDELENKISGVISYILWKAGHYYRVTGIHDVYNQLGTEVVMQIFTYEGLEPASITGLLKQATDKIAANAGNLVMATEAECTAALADLSSRINALNINQSES